MKKSKLLSTFAAIVFAFGIYSCNSDSPEITEDNKAEEASKTDNESDIWAEPAAEEPVVLTSDIETRAIRKTNSFSYKLLNAIQNDLDNLSEKNIFVSPLSVSMAMAMAANGATDETRDEIIDALGYTSITTMDGINQVNAKLLATLPDVDPSTKIAIANALWFNTNYNFYDYFKDVNKTYYNAGVNSLDFSQSDALAQINQWAIDNTDGLITELSRKLDPSSALVITNALYFKGDWTEPFEKSNAKIEFTNYTGESVKVPALFEYRTMLYNSNYKCEVATLPFGNGSYTFSVILPKTNLSITDAVGSLNNELFNNGKEMLLRFYMPKFAFENSRSLVDYLKALNINRAFRDDAQFSRISNTPLKITDVEQLTSIDLSEKGVEAAAATSAEFGVTDLDFNYKVFTADRPFAFVIRETSTGAVVFIGAINQL